METRLSLVAAVAITSRVGKLEVSDLSGNVKGMNAFIPTSKKKFKHYKKASIKADKMLRGNK